MPGPSSRPAAPAPAGPLREPLAFRLARAAAVATRPLQAQADKVHQVTLGEWRLLALLEAHPGLTVTQAAEALGLDKMAVSRAADGLSRRRRLQRHEDPADQRRSRLFLTGAGHALAAAVAAAGQAEEERLRAGLDAQALAHFEAVLDRLIAAG